MALGSMTRRAFLAFAQALLIALLVFASRAAAAKPALVVYPGSFDPAHVSHVAELEQTLAKIRAEHPEGVTAIVLPNHDQPLHLPGGAKYVFNSKQRETIARLAFQGVQGAEVHPAFADGTPTVDQIEQVAAPYAADHDLYLLVGEDAYRGMPRWKDVTRLENKFDLLVSVAPDRLDAMESPRTVLGEDGRAYRSRGKGTFRSTASGHQVRYLGVAVPDVRSRPILIDLMAGKAPDDRLPPAVQRFISHDAGIKASLEKGLHDNAAVMAKEMEPFVGRAAAVRARGDAAVVRHMLRPAPGVVHVPGVDRYMQSPQYQRLVKGSHL
jgi:nicotinic acid mononucleotide adenylyltransferase